MADKATPLRPISSGDAPTVDYELHLISRNTGDTLQAITMVTQFIVDGSGIQYTLADNKTSNRLAFPSNTMLEVRHKRR